MRKLDVPRVSLSVCSVCENIAQETKEGQIIPITAVLEANAISDDRMRNAISPPKVTTLRSLTEVFSTAIYTSHHRLLELESELRSLCAQIESRLDFAVEKLSELELVSDKATEAASMLRVARDMVSILPPRARGIQGKEGGG